ncbi:MAG: flagellar filament capping protein FliD, partial [Gammaproteobacteria bacterium]|nr:flagellar filament capping protein FliD [Gammaproteobacteria bacterium]
MATITSSGSGSGLDIAGIVDQLVAAERAPIANRLTARESKANELLSALGKFRSALATFQDSLKGLKEINTFQGRKVTVGDEKVFTATASTSSLPGNYLVEVTALAKAHRLSTAALPDATSAVGTGIISITVNGATSNIAIGDSANSLNDIRNAINAAPDNPGVRATIVNGTDGAHLVLSATKTGIDNAISVAVNGGDGGLAPLVYTAGGPANTMTQLTAATDAGVVIDGVIVSSATNKISDAIEGVTLNLVSANPGTELALGIGYDTDGAKRSVGNFVNSYNKLIDTVTELTKYNKDTRDAAPLLGDSTVRGIRDQLRREISGVPGADAASLASIGVTTQIDGKLATDATRLDAAIAADFDSIGELFSGETGL